MKTISELIKEQFSLPMPEVHVEANAGDYVGPEGLLHCGVCGEAKEYYATVLGRTVPCLCRCGRSERDEEERKAREANEMQRVQELARYSLGGDKIRNARFENAEVRDDMVKPMKIAKRYVENWDAISRGRTDMNGLLLYGPPGTGKTYLAACIANALMERNVPVLFTSVLRLTGTHPDELGAVLTGVKSAKLLVLDDLGAERATAFRLEQVYDIINERCNAGKPIVVTTNYTREQMARSTGEDDANYQQHNRVFERVKECCYPVLMNGESWRKERAKAAWESMKSLLEG